MSFENFSTPEPPREHHEVASAPAIDTEQATSFTMGPEVTLITPPASSALSHSARRPYEGDNQPSEAVSQPPKRHERFTAVPRQEAPEPAVREGLAPRHPLFVETAEQRAGRSDLPTPEHLPDADSMPEVWTKLESDADILARTHAIKTIEDGYTGPNIPIGEPLFRPSERVGTLPQHRTPAAWLVNLAQEPKLAEIDRKVAGLAHASGTDRMARDRLLGMAVKGVLGSYKVPREAITTAPGNNFEFPHKGNIVNVSINGKDIDVVVFDERTSQRGQARIEAEHDALVKAGSSLARFHDYLQTGNIPPYLADLTDEIEAHRDEIVAAYAEHALQTHAHAVENGYRQYSINTPSGLRYGLPLAVHLAEQPVRLAESVLGEYSPTRGFVHSPQLGLIVPAARAGAGRSSQAWRINRDGGLETAR